MNAPSWEHFEHQADVGIRGRGQSIAEAFEQVALAMSAVITDLANIEAEHVLNITCEGFDHELLLIDWLNALIFEMSTQKMLFSRFEVTIRNGRLSAKAWGEHIDVARHQPVVEIKGATYTELKVYQNEGQWIAQCVVDV